MEKRKRRSGEEVAKLIQEARALIDGGMLKEQAYDKVGISGSVYQRWERQQKKGGRKVHGSIKVSALPPRPKKKGKWGGKRKGNGLDMSKVSSVAGRISYLDKRIETMTERLNSMSDERNNLAPHLIKLLQLKA